jgi:hypothetical protein
MDDKYTKKETDYSRGHKDSHCGRLGAWDDGYCKHYIGTEHTGKCQIVEGTIKAIFWCNKFAKAKK